MGSNRRLLLGDKSELILSANKYSIGAGADTVTLTAKIGGSDVTSLAKYAVSYSRSHSENGNVVTFATLGTTETTSETITVTATCNGLTSNVVTITRVANVKSTTQDHSLSASCSDIPASGGYSNDYLSVTYYTTTYYKYTSGSTTTGGTTSSNLSTGYTTSQNLHGENLGTTVTQRKKLGDVAVSYGGESTSVSVYQQANTYTESGGTTTYGDVVAGSINNYTIPASGGSGTTTIGDGYQYWTRSATTRHYTSGATSTSSNSTSGTTPVSPSISSLYGSASSKGTTSSGRTIVEQRTVTWTGSGGKSDSDTAYVYQAANTYSDSGGVTSYGNIVAGSITNATISAGGGTGTAKIGDGYITYTVSAVTRTWTSGSTQTISSASSGQETVHPSQSTFSATAKTKGTTASNVTEVGKQTITWSAHGKSTSGTAYVYQEANKITSTTTSGGVYTYGEVTAGTITNKTIPAEGGTATSIANNGSQSWNKSATVKKDTYTSGSVNTTTTENATSGTSVVYASPASLKATATSKGTVVSGQTTVDSKTVTWSGSGGKSKTGTIYVYQAANYELRDEYDTSTFAFSSITNADHYAEARNPGCKKTTYYSSGNTKSSTEDVTINNAILGSCMSSSNQNIKSLATFDYGSNYIKVTIPTNYYFGSAGVTMTCTCGQDDFQAQYQL